MSFLKKTCISIVYSKCDHEYKKVFNEEEELFKTLKTLGLIINTEEYQKIYNHVWRIRSEGFRLKNIDDTKNYFIEEINQNELVSKKCEKVCMFWIILSTYLF